LTTTIAVTTNSIAMTTRAASTRRYTLFERKWGEDTRKMRTLKRERVKIALRTSASDKHFTSVQNPCIYVGMCRNSYQNVYQMFIRSFAPQHKIVAAFPLFHLFRCPMFPRFSMGRQPFIHFTNNDVPCQPPVGCGEFR
jgi:hypothetical protein